MGVDYLNGWDAMVATSQANVNQGLVLAYNANLLPHNANADFSFTVFGFEVHASVNATLGAWFMAGGSGKNVQISIPFTGGALTIAGTSYPLAHVVLEVTCLLSKIKSPVQPASGTNYTLQIDFLSPDAIVAVQVENPPPGLDTSGLDIVLLNLLKNTLGGHTYDVATVNLQSVKDDYPYLVPSLFDYAVDTNSSDPNSTIFGIQMLSVNTTPGNQYIIPGTVPTGAPACDSVALISNQIFVQHILLQGVASGMNVDASALATRLAGGAWSIVNNGDITLDSSHHPKLSSLTVTVDNNFVNFAIVGNCEPSNGVYVDFTMTAQYQMQLSETATAQTLNLVQVGSPDVQHSVTLAKWVIGLTAALAALVVVVMASVIGLILAGIALMIMFLVKTITNNKAGDILASSMPAVVASHVNWTHLQDFTIKQVLLPTPLQLGGTIPALSH